MPEFLTRLFDTDGFPARKVCGSGWAESPGLVWLHVGSDLFIWLAYLSIPLALLVFARRRGAVLPRAINRLFVLFAAFIVFCGFSHFFDALMFERPMYRWLGVVKLATAVVSWVTVLTLIPAIPKGIGWLDRVLADPARPPAQPADDDPDAWAGGYIVAVLAASAAVLVRAAFDPLLGSDHAFVIDLLAVVFVSWRCGFRPAVVTLLASMAATVYFFVEERHAFNVVAISDQLAVAAFVFCGVGCAALGEAQRSARRTAERTAADLRESEGRFRLLADTMPQMAWVTRPDGYHEFYNARWYEYTGLTEAESIGWGWAGPLHPDDRARSEARWRQSTSAGEPYEIEYRFRAADGSYRWFLGRAEPVRNAAGTVTRWFGTCTDIDDFKRLQDELKAREADFRTLADSIPALAWTARADGHIDWYNRRWYDYTGTTFEQMEGWGWEKVHDPAVLPAVVERWSHALAAGEPFEMTFPLRGADGGFRHFLTRIVPVRDADGRVARWFGSNTDIEDERRHADAVRASEARFRALAEAVPQIVWTAAPDGQVDWYNERWFEFTGLPRGGTGDGSWEPTVHPDDVARTRDAWAEAVRSGEPYQIEYRLRDAAGGFRWFVGRAVARRDDAGRVAQWVGTCTDVHDQKAQAETLERLVADRTAALRAEVDERRRAEAAVTRQREFLDVILENVTDGIVACDAGGRLTLFNRASREFHGLPPEPIPQEHWAGRYDLFAADGRTPLPTDRVPLVRALHGERVRDAEMVIAPAGHPPRSLLASGQPLIDAGGVNLGAVVSMRDVTEQRRLEDRERAVALELRRSNAELEQFAYVASHDLQEPLRKIQAFGDRLSTRFREQLGEQGKDYVDRMLSSAGRMRRLIDDLLTFSRVTTKAQPFTRVELTALAADALSDLDERVTEAGGRVEVGDLPAIDADPFQMRQLFLNLIANGLKFRRPGVPPVVTVTGELVRPAGENGSPAAAGEWCRVTVADNGIGFDEKYLPRLFQVFQRLHGRDEYEGTGVGLAICRKIVERHGGEITASARPGEGAAFVFTVPARHDGGPPADAE